MSRAALVSLVSALVLLLGACSGTVESSVDAGSNDASSNDASPNDAGSNDAGRASLDAGSNDAGRASLDAGRDAATDAGLGDAGSVCDPPCFEGVECVEAGDGYRCGECPAGLEGDGVICVEIDGCAGNPCFAGVTCTDVPAPDTGFTCGACPVGTEGDGVSCVDIDGCAGDPCFAGVTCTDVPAPDIGFTCGACPVGTEGDGVSCVDIDGCAGDPCFAGVTCTDRPAPDTGFTCGACPSGLQGDGRDCTEIDGCAGDPCLNAVCMDVPAPGTGHTCGTCAPGTSGPDCAVPDCTGPRYCAGPVSGAASTFSREVTSGVNYNVGLSNAVDTPNGAAVGFTAALCCIDGTGSAGVLFADATHRVVSVFSGASRAGIPPEPALSFDGSVLHLFDPFAAYATRRTVNPTSLALGSPASVALSGRDWPPAVVPRPGGHMALVGEPGTGPRIRRFNAAFGAPVSTTLVGSPLAMPALSTTCGGNALGVWLGSTTTGTLLTRAFNREATPLNPAGSVPDAEPAYGYFLSRAYRVSFDGRLVVVAVHDAVLELRADGSLVRRTPVPGVLAAAGTSDGLIVVRRNATSGDGSPVELVARETGAVIRELTRIPTGAGGYAADAAVAIHQDASGASVHFFATSFRTRSSIVGATVRCR